MTMTTLNRRSETTRQPRGLRSYRWGMGQAIEMVLLLIVCWFLLAATYPDIQAFWRDLLAWAWPRLGIGPGSAVALDQVQFLGRPWDVVGLHVSTTAPTTAQAWVTLLVLALLFLLSLLVPRRHLPWIYFWRALVVLGAMSTAAFLAFPTLLDVEVSGYFNGLMQIGSIILWLVHVLHAGLLYIFPLGALHKLLATVVAVVFVIVSVPFHVGTLAWIVHETNTLVLLPIYMVATFLPPVFAQIGIYSYFVSNARVSERRSTARAQALVAKS